MSEKLCLFFAAAAAQDLLAFGLDIAGLGQLRAEELVIEHGEEYDVAALYFAWMLINSALSLEYMIF